MKNLMRISLMAIFSIALFLSCNDDDNSSIPSNFVLNEAVNVESPQAGSTIEINADNLGSSVINLNWLSPSATEATAVHHTVEIDMPGNGFMNAQEVGSLIGNSTSISGSKLNDILASLGALPLNSTPIELRVKSTVDKENYLMSNSLTFNVTAFDPNSSDTPFLYIAKDYPNWNFLTAEKLTSDQDNGIYGHPYYIFPEATSFNLVDPSGNVWGAGTAFDGQFVQGGSPIMIENAGMYHFEVNPSGETYTADQRIWGVIGSATPMGWADETPLMLDLGTGIWSGTVELTAGELKFRANHDWGINLGDDGADGSMEPGGSNILNTLVGPTSVILDFSDPWNPAYMIGDVAPIMSGNMMYLSTDGSTTDGMETIYSMNANGSFSGFDYLTTSDSFYLIDPMFNNGEVWGSDNGMDIGAGQGAISVSEDGFYRIQVDLQSETITLTKTDWAVVGPATGLGWPAGPDGTAGQDLDMTLDAATETWSVTATFEAGEFKFRPNDRWDLFDFGAGDSAGTLVLGAGTPNLSLDAGGTYTITLNASDDMNYTYTIE